MHLPAILHNAGNYALRQVEAHNAQQREKLKARREAQHAVGHSQGAARGKRVMRRRENGQYERSTSSARTMMENEN